MFFLGTQLLEFFSKEGDFLLSTCDAVRQAGGSLLEEGAARIFPNGSSFEDYRIKTVTKTPLQAVA